MKNFVVILMILCMSLSIPSYKAFKRVNRSGVTFNFVDGEVLKGISYKDATLRLVSTSMKEYDVQYHDSDTLLFCFNFDVVVGCPLSYTLISSCDTLFFVTKFAKKPYPILVDNTRDTYNSYWPIYSAIRNNNVALFKEYHAQSGGITRTGPPDDTWRIEIHKGRITGATRWIYEIVFLE